MTVEERAKARSTLVTKTFFRLAACTYLSWSAYRQLYQEYMKDPETHTKGYLIFAGIFVTAAAVYFIYAIRVFLREAKKQNAEWAAMDRAAAERGADGAEASEEAGAAGADDAELSGGDEAVGEDNADVHGTAEAAGADAAEAAGEGETSGADGASMDKNGAAETEEAGK